MAKLTLVGRSIALSAMIGLVPLLSANPVEAAGCIKGAVVGGVAGHYAGHGVIGALGGCAVGHHLANEKAAQEHQEKLQQEQYNANRAYQQQPNGNVAYGNHPLPPPQGGNLGQDNRGGDSDR